MSKIGIEPIRSIFGIAACVFQMAPHAGNAPASQVWETWVLLLYEWGIEIRSYRESNPARFIDSEAYETDLP